MAERDVFYTRAWQHLSSPVAVLRDEGRGELRQRLSEAWRLSATLQLPGDFPGDALHREFVRLRKDASRHQHATFGVFECDARCVEAHTGALLAFWERMERLRELGPGCGDRDVGKDS